ncbi:TetR family transcriptional regulator [Streptomyces sp. NPDC048251]|uniref:TetR family transcriptional regulator n=1 Tax=Streptomyces sp. NPDC048251 TaxID=3154501 RepID=UPI00343ED3AA
METVALRLFEDRGFDQVTIDEIAAEAHISVRTFYRYFPAKEDVFQVRIDRSSEALRVALAARQVDEAPLRSLRLALEETASQEDEAFARRWTAVVVATPSVLRTVLGGYQLNAQRSMAEFLGSRLGLAADALVPGMLAAAVGGVIQTARMQWFIEGGDLVARMSAGLELLERAIGSDPRTWSGAEVDRNESSSGEHVDPTGP